MASTTSDTNNFILNIKDFPPVINERINIVKFLAAADDLVLLVERLGKIFAPVKYDMQGNIDKIKKFYVFDDSSCLLELMLEEVNNGKCNGAEGVLWLNRAIYFFELIFQDMLKSLQAKEYNINLTKIYIAAYDGSVKKYHNWITQQLFALICRLSPTFGQIMQSLEIENDLNAFELKIQRFTDKMHLNRCEIDDFFKRHNLFQ